MLRFLKGFFGKPKHPSTEQEKAPVAPYKVEAPVTPAIINAEIVPQYTVDGHGDVQETKPAKAKKAPAKKKPAAIKAPAKPKTPRKPKTPK